MALKLSVITPSYNQGKYIERTIRSVLDQGYEDLEYVIVDGGSTDETLEIIRRYEDRLAWWVSEPDDGQTHAINKGIEGTSGEIVAYINSDDYYLPGAFEKAVAALEQSDAPWLAGASVDMGGDTQLEDYGIWRPAPPSAVEGPLKGRHWWLLAPWHVPQPSSFWRRSLFEEIGPFRTDMHYAFDAEFMLRAAMAERPPELLPDDVLAVRFMHPAQKGSNIHYWRPELKQIAELHGRELAPFERRRLRSLLPLVIAYRSLRDWVIHPLMRLGGRSLERVPAGLRPRIRHRDRRRHLAD